MLKDKLNSLNNVKMSTSKKNIDPYIETSVKKLYDNRWNVWIQNF